MVVETPFGEDGRDDDDDEDDQTDRLARDLIENTAPEPSPPPAAEDGPQQPQQGKQLLLMTDARVDGEMALGDMITPRPTEEAEQDVVEDTPEAAIG